MKNQFLFIFIFTFVHCFIYAFAENAYYIVSIRRNKNDTNYDEASLTVQNKIDSIVNERMNDIYQLIIDNKDSYILENGKLDEKLNELNKSLKSKRHLKKEKFQFINPNRQTKNKNKNNDNKNKISYYTENQFIPIESELVVHICPVSNYYAIKAYFSDLVAKKVEKLPNVTKVVKNGKLIKPKKATFLKKEKRATSNNNNNNNNNNKNKNNNTSTSYYNIEYIKKETQWNSVSVEKNAPLHLSLISQNNYITSIVNTYDTNYYYPTTSGKGIDIYLIDAGIDTNHVEFDTYNGERTVSCDAIVVDGRYKKVKQSICDIGDKKKKWENIRHGTMVASVVGGKLYGVAKKANIHMIATDFYYDDLVAALDYILNNAKPYKTIINVSRNGKSDFFSILQDKINDIVKAGFIITASSGNDGENGCIDGDQYEFISGYSNVISVGSINNDNDSKNNLYSRSDYSNYGKCVSLHAPGSVKGAGICKNSKKVCSTIDTDDGTSFSSPIVAGVAALIMGENRQTKFNYKTILNRLTNMSVKGIIKDLKKGNTPNNFINNGKHIVYSKDNKYKGCGILSGNHKCSNNQCCTEKCQCISSTNNNNNNNNNLCYIENGCQSSFGKCQTLKSTQTSQTSKINNFDSKGMTSNTLGQSINSSNTFAKVWINNN
ncbi:subtilisin-like protein [Anaeromyces robustus]|uniref:Subtilisin-like protein n=1 Tax=Anaeromyces robustus TaxID=1754192 RepID=A0A1Y1WQD5_9FUNG|nr:subtilisin-like protein [Anaeromyces robustus]|eukprot:ORX75743.1 subtilisin-like protein [Anaeromyces robustus]